MSKPKTPTLTELRAAEIDPAAPETGYRRCAVRPANPKAAFGKLKADLSLIPRPAMIHMAEALENGADKYGAYNWRQTDVDARIYISALLRHIFAWLDGEDDAPDSGVSHLGHVMAGCAILLDAKERGNLFDDRTGGEQK